MGETFDLYFNSVGGQYSYGYSVSLLWTSGTAFLAHSDNGSKVSYIGFCFRPFTSFIVMPDSQEGI